jgi:hypothetical protein
MRRFAFPSVALLLCALSFSVSQRNGNGNADGVAQGINYQFKTPIDALSIGTESGDIDLSVSAWTGIAWTPWQPLAIEKEFDPTLQESNLVMFPSSVSTVRFRGATRSFTVHPIRVSDDPVRYEVASLTAPERPRIITRSMWGADENLLFVDAGSSVSRSDVQEQNTENSGNGAVPARVEACEKAQVDYPDEFKVKTTIRTEGGKTYRWPLQYSKNVKLLVVHHTALAVGDDPRPSVERMRALFQYHTQNRGWGDIGYHYVIDEDGVIYEGKRGGKSVVGGHAYCDNIGSVGIALMGDLSSEEPSQKQLESLKRLLSDLADLYDIDLTKSVKFHGMTYDSPILGHGDLLSTECPGYYVRGAMPQIRLQTIAKAFSDTVTLPKSPHASSSSKISTPSTNVVTLPGGASIALNPGGRQRFSIAVRAGNRGIKKGERIISVSREGGIGLWQDINGKNQRVSTKIISPVSLRPGKNMTIPLLLQAPRTAGSYTLRFNESALTLTVGGRRARSSQSFQISSRSSSVQRTSRASSSKMANDHVIRLRLTTTNNVALSFDNTLVKVPLSLEGNDCIANVNGVQSRAPVLRFSEDEVGILSVTTEKGLRMYHGTIECRVSGGALMIINELPLEAYLAGLSEEPDTEPYEKQRAFAIAARTYALYYLDAAHRKFPGMPFDGSDDPATFQAYAGITFERGNPSWLRAVASTKGRVLTYRGALIKPAYFSSDDGRTRSPEEAGWNNFPAAEIFSSKPDPWCKGLSLRGHGVGMSGCGASGQAKEGKSAEEILQYYYPEAILEIMS